jgi:co-chaperonin GroES (HSP10)|tara:strand:- start:3792 stop:4337 length:546 start_codon:yes stop_codon:yes gene_type:complete
MIKPIRDYLIKPLGAEYIKEKDGIIVSSGIEDYKGVNRYGVLVSKPDNDDSELSIGDVCVVHHNCFRTYYNMKGKETKSNEHFRDNLYLIPTDKVYLYKSEKKWKPIKDYCFVEPMVYQQDSELYVPKEKEEHVGLIKYSNSATLNEGDKVGFKPNREYEFSVDDKKVYRMKNSDILIKLD